MSLLFWILIFTFLGSFASLIGGILLLWKEKLVEGKTLLLVAFAAGAMLSASFFDLIPEALEEGMGYREAGEAILAGIVVFFLFERFLLWHHHHQTCEAPRPTIPLLILGDSLHNFLDGVVIAGSFLLNIPLGIITSLAVGFHEVPQEIGDFGVLLALGMGRRKVILVNIFSALASFVGAISAFYFLSRLGGMIPYLIAFAAGNFIYIASSDLIPEIHRAFKREEAFSQTGFFILGILVIWLTTSLFA